MGGDGRDGKDGKDGLYKIGLRMGVVCIRKRKSRSEAKGSGDCAGDGSISLLQQDSPEGPMR